jgi:hypothetical protein
MICILWHTISFSAFKANRRFGGMCHPAHRRDLLLQKLIDFQRTTRRYNAEDRIFINTAVRTSNPTCIGCCILLLNSLHLREGLSRWCITPRHSEISFNWCSGSVEPNWVHSPLRPLIGLLSQPQVIMIMEKLM